MTNPPDPAERLAAVRALLDAESVKLSDIAARTDRNGRVHDTVEAKVASLTPITITEEPTP